MPKFTNTEEYMKKLGNLKLSDSARERISGELDAYADMHAITVTERIAEESRSTTEVSQTTVWQTALFTFNRRTMPIFAVLAIMLVGGTSLAAQGSLPGDLLYPVKTEVTENIRGALALGADAEARLQADLLEERVAEAEALEATGRLNGRLAVEVESNVASQYQKAVAANAEADANTDSRLATSLGRLASLSTNGNVTLEGKMMAYGEDSAAGESTMAMGAPTAESMPPRSGGGVSADSDTAVSTSLALEPIEVGQLQQMTTARMESLREVLARYQNDIRADVYAEFSATLDEADQVMMRVMLQSSTDTARELLYVVSDLVGKVEAALSLMGTVKIDADTGAIVDIDLSTPPPTEPDRGDAGEPIPEPLPLPLPPEIMDSDSGVGGVDGEIEAGLEATSQISL